ncbi:MAG: helix-turn-helix transcriptional regulator [Clostridia bacterium]|nr:helix-turn-helix transcriptional regulator [Clostridia bacterium]
MFDFGLNLRKIRKKRKMTQKQLANKVYVSEATISKYESNLVFPPYENIRSLATVLEISADELCGLQPSESAALYNLTTEQKQLVNDMITALRKHNSGITAGYEENCELLGKITAELLQK